MTILNILKFPNKNLQLKAKQIDKVNKDTLIEIKDMIETLFYHNGLGLAATQVNINKRIIIINLSLNKFIPLVIINPIIINQNNITTPSVEGCLSFPNIFIKINRKTNTTISYYDINMNKHILQAKNLINICIQHEIDHLNGITLYNNMSNLKKKLLQKKYDKNNLFRN